MKPYRALNIILLTKPTNLLPTWHWTTIRLTMLKNFWLADHEGLLSIANQNWNKFTKEECYLSRYIKIYFNHITFGHIFLLVLCCWQNFLPLEIYSMSSWQLCSDQIIFCTWSLLDTNKFQIGPIFDDFKLLSATQMNEIKSSSNLLCKGLDCWVPKPYQISL